MTLKKALAAVSEACNRLDFVRWDRFITWDENGQVYSVHIYGWIDRDDGRADFVLLWFHDSWGWRPEDCSATTSSSAYSERIQELLRGTAEGHIDCQRVDEHFGDLIANKVELGK
jgi:hypothetical protein